jgi:hypothetical protein
MGKFIVVSIFVDGLLSALRVCAQISDRYYFIASQRLGRYGRSCFKLEIGPHSHAISESRLPVVGLGLLWRHKKSIATGVESL